ncbi:hypothetical protein [Zhongshania aliphaticivorans]|nr:hypothetical protein [Zhongshania aliphaticivorans]
MAQKNPVWLPAMGLFSSEIRIGMAIKTPANVAVNDGNITMAPFILFS